MNDSADRHVFSTITRREVLKVAASGLLVGVGNAVIAQDKKSARRAKKIVVAGGGIGGLCCAYELTKRGHDVTLLEASGRAGGHVRTIHDPLPDGLYADVGAEHFTNPGYDQYRKYVEEFQLPVLAYPRRINMQRRIDNRWFGEEQLQDRKVLKGFGFNMREAGSTRYVKRHCVRLWLPNSHGSRLQPYAVAPSPRPLPIARKKETGR